MKFLGRACAWLLFFFILVGVGKGVDLLFAVSGFEKIEIITGRNGKWECVIQVDGECTMWGKKLK